MTTTTQPKAYDMSRYQRVIGTDGRISGKWIVFEGRKPREGEIQEYIVKPIDVTIYDDTRLFGRTLNPGDLTAWVDAVGNARIPEHMIAEHIRPEVQEVWNELINLLSLITTAFIAGPSERVWTTGTPSTTALAEEGTPR